VPVAQQDKAVGHAVRAVYLYSGMTDAAALYGDPAYKQAVDKLWSDMTSKRMYLTGASALAPARKRSAMITNSPIAALTPRLRIHREHTLEPPHVSPGRRCEVSGCAEQVLYNGYLSGVSLSGDKFFYQNPLESVGRNERSAYFDVACCPANLARMMAQFPA